MVIVAFFYEFQKAKRKSGIGAMRHRLTTQCRLKVRHRDSRHGEPSLERCATQVRHDQAVRQRQQWMIGGQWFRLGHIEGC
jgi:hypothetical protein